MKRFAYTIAMLALILMSGCKGETGKIHSAVEVFLDETVADGYHYDIDKYEFWDSTYSVSVDAVAANKEYADQVTYFKKSIKYHPYKSGDKLYFVGVHYKLKKDDSEPKDCKQTFYIDKDLEGVVCVKDN